MGVLKYQEDETIDTEKLDRMNHIINKLRYLKLKEDAPKPLYKPIDISYYKTVYCNIDWHYILNRNNKQESYLRSGDPRAIIELDKIDKTFQKQLIKS